MRILVISPFPTDRAALAALLVADGHQVTTANDHADGLARAVGDAPQVILVDVRIPEADGLAFARAVAARDVHARVIGMSARAHRGPSADIVWLTKPIDLAQLERALPADPRAA